MVGYFQFNDTASRASYNLIDSSFFVLANGVNKTASSAPVGAGFSAVQNITSSGIYTFGTTGIILRFASGTNPQGNVWITKLNQLPDQYPHASILPNGYFIVNNYGANSTFSPTIYVKANTNINVSSANALTPSTFKLFKRLSNGDGPNWGNFINSASAATAGTPGNVTFNPGAISSEGQLFVNGGVQAPQVDSVAGKMLDFTSVGNPVDSLSSIPINSNRFSIMMWVKPKGLQKVFSQILSSQPPNTKFGIGFAYPGNYIDNLNLVFTYDNVINFYQQSTINLLSDQWNHVALTYTLDSVCIYLNGGTPWVFPKANSLTPSGFPAVDLSKAPVTVNADIHAQSGNYKGQEDEISFYNYPLTQQEIREKMFLTKKPGIENGLVGYYQFNQYDSTKNTLYDAMGYGTASTVNKINIVPSTVPVAAGASFRIASVNTGTYNFPGTGISLTFSGPIVPNGEMVVTRLRAQPDSMPSGYTRLSSNYWIISNYGISPFTQPTQMKFDSINISVADAASPSVLKLLKRSTNEFINNWAGPLCNAQWAYSGTYGSVIYINNCNNTTFGQYLIGTTGGSQLRTNSVESPKNSKGSFVLGKNAFINISPNPVYGNQSLSLRNLDNVKAEINFYLSEGKVYRKYSLAPWTQVMIYTLPKGALFYRATNEKGKTAHGIVVVQ